MRAMNRQDLPAIVTDPALRPWELRLVQTAGEARAAWSRVCHDIGIRTQPDRLLTVYLAIAATTAAFRAVSSGWAWAGFFAGTAVFAGLAAAALRRAARRYSGRHVLPGTLDPGAQELLARAHAAASAVLGSAVRCSGHLDVQGSAAFLAARQWDIAWRLSEAGRLAAEYARLGPAPYAAGPQADLAEVRAAAARQVSELEGYAAIVAAADAAYLAWAAQLPAAGLGDRVDWLLAGLAADDHSRTVLEGLRADASATAAEFLALLPDALPQAGQPEHREPGNDPGSTGRAGMAAPARP